jgi:hypothetical protein
MKIKNILTTALLAFASMALVSTTARATALTYTDGDVFLGFSNPTATYNLVIKVGVLPGYTDGSLGTLNHTFTIGNYAADLSSIFGASWATDATLTYTAFGGDISAPGNLVISQPTTTAAPAIDSGTGQVLFTNMMPYIQGNYGNGSENTAGLKDFKEAVSAGGSLQSYMSGGANSPTGLTWAAVPSTAQEAVTGKGYIDIYNLAPNGDGSAAAATVPGGYFSVASNGDVSYNVASVPEPSTYAMLGIGALAMGVVIRRKIKAANA